MPDQSRLIGDTDKSLLWAHMVWNIDGRWTNFNRKLALTRVDHVCPRDMKFFVLTGHPNLCYYDDGNNNHLLVNSHLTASILLWTIEPSLSASALFSVNFQGEGKYSTNLWEDEIKKIRQDSHDARVPEKFEEAIPRSMLVKACRLGAYWGPFWYWRWPHSPHPVNVPMP